MPQSLSKVYTHIIFSTKDREKWIDENIEEELFRYIGGISQAHDCPPIRVGGYQNYIHILCRLSRKMLQATLLEVIKRQSSKWIKTKGYQCHNLRLWSFFRQPEPKRYCSKLYS